MYVPGWFADSAIGRPARSPVIAKFAVPCAGPVATTVITSPGTSGRPAGVTVTEVMAPAGGAVGVNDAWTFCAVPDVSAVTVTESPGLSALRDTGPLTPVIAF